MIDQIFPGLYRLKIPLPGHPLRAVNSYLIKGDDRNLLIDTGMNRPECKQAFKQALQELDTDLTHTDLFITHLHADHSGLVTYLKSSHSKIYGSRADTDVINNVNNCWGMPYWNSLADFAVKNGFLEGKQVIHSHPAFRSCNHEYLQFDIVDEDTHFDIDEYSLKCIMTPGHSRGHVCLYEENNQILFSGDHILADVTPNISLFATDYDPLDDYLQSLDKIFDLKVRLTLPAHRSVIDNHKERINELKKHHQLRCDNILNLLEYGPANAFDIASRMTWNLSYHQWEEFPLPQKWFATGEAVAHLKYLCEKGKAVKYDGDGITLFSLPA